MTTALILGAAVWQDGPSPTLRRRAQAGAALYHEGKVSHIIACGGLGQHPPSEAEAIAKLLQDAGVPARAITLEDRSTTTSENIANATALLDTNTIILVSDWYHLPRAKLVARREGLTVSATASPGLKGARALPQIKASLREIPAYCAYLLRLRG